MAHFCFGHPDDAKAAYYLERIRHIGDAALDEMLGQGEIDLVNKVLAERRAFRSIGTQAGDRGAAQDLWPGITEVLSSMPAKASVFDWLKESEKFCIGIIELATEIALDNNWSLDYARMMQELQLARGSRKLGEYAADSRAKMRLHGKETSRITSGKATAA